MFLYACCFLRYSMKFAHLADVHIGAWRDRRLSSLPDEAFDRAVRLALLERVDFIVIAGDLFNSALPGIDHLRSAVRSLGLAKAAGVPVYAIPGSHDFSPSGKSMLHVLEEAGLLVDVFGGEVVDGKLRLRVVRDQKTGAAITGILGRRGMLDHQEYERLDEDWLARELVGARERVFLFHTAIGELLPQDMSMMESSPVGLLPGGFSYYAGGHVHIVAEVKTGPGAAPVVYPGPLFPANFGELEKLGSGGFVIVDDGVVRRVSVQVRPVVSLQVRAEVSSPEEVTQAILEKVEAASVQDAIVLLRVSGSLRQGSASDVDFRRVVALAADRGAFVLLRHAGGLVSRQVEELVVRQSSAERIEEELIAGAVGKVACSFADREAQVARELLHALAAQQEDGESKGVFDERVVGEAKRLLGLGQR